MRIYRNRYYDPDGDECNGYSYHASKTKARASYRMVAKEGPTSKLDEVAIPLDVEMSKAGVIAALNKYGSHNDNG